MKYYRLKTLAVLAAFGSHPMTTLARIGQGSSGLTTGATTNVSSTGGSDGISDSTAEVCNTKDNGNFVSQEFLRSIVDPAEDPNYLRVDTLATGNGRQRMVTIPNYLSACTDLKILYKRKGNDHFIRVKNNFQYDLENTGLFGTDGAQEKFDQMSMEQKHEACLRKLGYLNEQNDLTKEARQKAYYQDNHLSSISTRPFVVDGSNRRESISLFYASPKINEYGIAFPTDDVKSKPNWSCVAYENVNGNEVHRLSVSEKDRRLEHAMKICQNRNPEEIMEEIARSYRDGHDDIAKILEKVFDEVKVDRVQEIYDRLDEIELELAVDKDGEGPSRDHAREMVGEYKLLVDELDKIVVSPGITKIRNLLAKRNPRNKEETDRKIAEINEAISKFSKKSPSKSNLKFVYAAAEKYALLDEIKDIEEMRLSSNFYGRVGKGKRGIRFSKAEREIAKNLGNFERIKLSEWSALHSLRSGNDNIILAYEKEIRFRYNRMKREAEDLEDENKRNLKRYCSVTMIGTIASPSRCDRWRKDYVRFKQNMREDHEQDREKLAELSKKHQYYTEIYEKGIAEGSGEDDTDYDDGFEVFGGKKPKKEQRRRRRDSRIADRGDSEMTRARLRDQEAYDRQMGRQPMAQAMAQPQQMQWGMNNGPTMQQPGQNFMNPGMMPQYNNQFNMLARTPSLQSPSYVPSYNAYTSYMGPQMSMPLQNNSFMTQNTFQMGPGQPVPFFGQQAVPGQPSQILGPNSMGTPGMVQQPGFSTMSTQGFMGNTAMPTQGFMPQQNMIGQGPGIIGPGPGFNFN